MSVSKIIPFHPHVERNSPLFAEAKLLVERLKQEGFIALFTGESIRDMYLDRPVKDIDIATNASVDQLLKLFPKALCVGAQFGVIRVRQKNCEFEVATFRKESDYVDGRHPQHVEKTGHYEEDAKRRDFTMNGLFYDPFEEVILDCVHGIKDIQKKLIRTIGNAEERFQEDKLRILRAVRFCHDLEYSIAQETFEAMCHLSYLVPQCVSGERIWDELQKMSTAGKLCQAFRTMIQIGLLQALFPFVLSKDELERRISRLENIDSPLVAPALAFLFFDQPNCALFMKEQLHVSNNDEIMIDQFQTLSRGFVNPELSEKECVCLLALSHAHLLLPYIASLHFDLPDRWLTNMIKKEEELRPWIDQMSSKKFLISGKELLDRGIKPGKEVGLLMEKAFDISLKKRLLDKEALLNEIL